RRLPLRSSPSPSSRVKSCCAERIASNNFLSQAARFSGGLAYNYRCSRAYNLAPSLLITGPRRNAMSTPTNVRNDYLNEVLAEQAQVEQELKRQTPPAPAAAPPAKAPTRDRGAVMFKKGL